MFLISKSFKVSSSLPVTWKRFRWAQHDASTETAYQKIICDESGHIYTVVMCVFDLAEKLLVERIIHAHISIVTNGNEHITAPSIHPSDEPEQCVLRDEMGYPSGRHSRLKI